MRPLSVYYIVKIIPICYLSCLLKAEIDAAICRSPSVRQTDKITFLFGFFFNPATLLYILNGVANLNDTYPCV